MCQQGIVDAYESDRMYVPMPVLTGISSCCVGMPAGILDARTPHSADRMYVPTPAVDCRYIRCCVGMPAGILDAHTPHSAMQHVTSVPVCCVDVPDALHPHHC